MTGRPANPHLNVMQVPRTMRTSNAMVPSSSAMVRDSQFGPGSVGVPDMDCATRRRFHPGPLPIMPAEICSSAPDIETSPDTVNMPPENMRAPPSATSIPARLASDAPRSNAASAATATCVSAEMPP